MSSSNVHELLVLDYFNKYSWCFECTLKNKSCLFGCEVLNKYVELDIKQDLFLRVHSKHHKILLIYSNTNSSCTLLLIMASSFHHFCQSS